MLKLDLNDNDNNNNNKLVLDTCVTDLFKKVENHKHDLNRYCHDEYYELCVTGNIDSIADYPEDKQNWKQLEEEEAALKPAAVLELMEKRIEQLVALDKKKSDGFKINKICIDGSSVFVKDRVVAFVGSYPQVNKQMFLVDTYNRKIWRGPSLPLNLLHGKTVHIGNGDMFVCGGFLFADGQFVCTDRCWIVNGISGRCIECPPMPTARAEHAMVYVESLKTVVVMGGEVADGTDTDVCEYFDVVGRKWNKWTGKINLARSQFTATLIPESTRVVVIGGCSSTDDNGVRSIEWYDVKERKTTHVIRMQASIYGHSAFVSGPQHITVVGGAGTRMNNFVTPDLKYNFKTNRMSELPTARHYNDEGISYRCNSTKLVKHNNFLRFENPTSSTMHCQIFNHIQEQVTVLI